MLCTEMFIYKKYRQAVSAVKTKFVIFKKMYCHPKGTTKNFGNSNRRQTSHKKSGAKQYN